MNYVLSLLPALLMWEYVSVKVNFRLDRKTRKRLFRVGFLTALAALLLEFPVPGFVQGLPLAPVPGLAVKALLVGVIEEGVDFVGLLFLADRDQIATFGPAAAIPLAAGIGLGFAVLENMFYLGAAALHGQMATVSVLRAFTAIPEHAFDGMVMGAFFCIARQSRRGLDMNAAVLAWVVPALMHAAYDFTAFAESTTVWAVWVFQILLLGEGLLTAALVGAAPGAEARISAAEISDEYGMRALVMSGLLLLFGNGLLYLATRAPQPMEIAAIAVAPMVLGVDLALVGLRRRSLA